MANSPSQPRRRSRLFWLLLAVPLLLVALFAVSEVFTRPRSFLYERDAAGGPWRLVEGEQSMPFRISWDSYKIESTTTQNATQVTIPAERLGRPFTQSSITVVDLSGTETSSWIANHFAQSLRARDSFTRIDCRLLGEALETPRMGELILMIEEIEVTRPGFARRNTHHIARLGYVPQYGWTDNGEVLGPIVASWKIEGSFRYTGTPWSLTRAIAAEVAETIDLDSILLDAAEKQEPLPAAPDSLMPAGYAGPSESRVAEVTGLEEAPVLRGVRAAVAGETIWRYEGEDVEDRLASAVEAFEASGWEHGPGWSSGVDGVLHRAYLRSGTERVEWTYEENRTGMLQREIWSSTTNADGSRGESTRRVEGPALPPVLWVHYWNETDVETLQPAWNAAQSTGEEARNTFLGYLSNAQRQSLGIGPEEDM